MYFGEIDSHVTRYCSLLCFSCSYVDVTRRTITLIKSQSISHGESNVGAVIDHEGEVDDDLDVDASLRPSLATNIVPKRPITAAAAQPVGRRPGRPPSLATAMMRNSTAAAASLVAAVKTPASRRMARARRLPAWYKDYDTDYLAGEEGSESAATAAIKAALPAGIELTDPTANAADDGVPTEEWNIVVYDDEEVPMADEEEEIEEPPEEEEEEDMEPTQLQVGED